MKVNLKNYVKYDTSIVRIIMIYLFTVILILVKLLFLKNEMEYKYFIYFIIFVNVFALIVLIVRLFYVIYFLKSDFIQIDGEVLEYKGTSFFSYPYVKVEYQIENMSGLITKRFYTGLFNKYNKGDSIALLVSNKDYKKSIVLKNISDKIN